MKITNTHSQQQLDIDHFNQPHLPVYMHTQCIHNTHIAYTIFTVHTTHHTYTLPTLELLVSLVRSELCARLVKILTMGNFFLQVTTEKMKQFTNWRVSWTLKLEVMGLKLRKNTNRITICNSSHTCILCLAEWQLPSEAKNSSYETRPFSLV